jgi:ribosome biogenesis GTPase A
MKISKQQLQEIIKECVCEELNEQQRSVPTFEITPDQVADIITHNALQTLVKAHSKELQEKLPFDYKRLYFMLKNDKVNAIIYQMILSQLEDGWDQF